MKLVRIFAIPLLFVLFWQIASIYLLDPFWISTPSKVALRLTNWVTSFYIFGHMWATLQEMIVGYLLGALIAIIFGFGLYFIPRVQQVIMPFITAIYALPKVALAPLFVIYFGIGIESKLALVVFAVFFLVFQNTWAGTQNVDHDLTQLLTVFGASELEIFWKVVFPSSIVWILTGLRVSIRYAVTSAVVAEIVSSNRGVGFLIQHFADGFDSAGVFSALITLLSFGLALNAIINKLEMWVSKWREE